MKIENHTKIPDKDLKRLFSQAISRAPLGADAKSYLRTGLYVQVNNGKYSRVRGRIWPEAIEIHRKGKPIVVSGYIKLFVFKHTTINDLAHTFAHELSHFKDWYNSVHIYPQGYTQVHKVPWGKERRAEAFADKVINKISKES